MRTSSGERHANLERVLADASQVRRHGLFIWEVVEAHVARSPKDPTTLHYRGGGKSILAGKVISRRRLFRPDMLDPD